MFKRVFWLSVGVVVGWGGSLWLQRRMRRAIERYMPERLAVDVSNKARSFGADLRDAAREGRAAMRAQERWLRDDVDTERPG